ncbi:MAG: glycosyltransferase family 61 protein [Anaerolineales bacterium]
MKQTIKKSPSWVFARKVRNTLFRYSRRVRNIPPIFNRSPKWLNSPEYAKIFNAKWHKVFEQMPTKHSPVVYYGALMADLQRRLDTEFPELGVLELNNALLYGKSGWIFSKEGYLLPDHSWYGKHVDEIKKVPRFLPKGKHVEGVCLSLVSDFGHVYGHFVLDCLPRLELFNKAGFKLTEVDHIICWKPPPGNARRLFENLDIPSNKFIWVDSMTAIRVDTLLAPSFPGTRRNYPKWVPEFLKQKFTPSPPAPNRRIYIFRTGNSRIPVNQEAVNRILFRHGFEIYNPSDHVDSHIDFSEAKFVVGVHGSGLTGLAFCQPGTKVLELIPTDHAYPYYYTLSNAAGLDYGCLVCRSTNERGPDAWGPSPYNFYVNENEFDDALARITGETK